MVEVIGGASSMKAVRAAVHEYDTELPLAIAVLERRLGRIVVMSKRTKYKMPMTPTK